MIGFDEWYALNDALIKWVAGLLGGGLLLTVAAYIVSLVVERGGRDQNQDR